MRKLAPKVDAVIVVGSKISSNTKKLFQIARESNRNVMQIETCADLQRRAHPGQAEKIPAPSASAPGLPRRRRNWKT